MFTLQGKIYNFGSTVLGNSGKHFSLHFYFDGEFLLTR